MTPRIAMWSFLAATFALHAVVAWLAPLATDDWNHLIWASAYDDVPVGDWIVEFLAKNPTFADLANFALAKLPILHALVTPLVGLALIWGVFVLALRRFPRFDAWDDVLAVIAIAALLWIGAPRLGLVYFHRPFAATWLYGTALAVWFLVPFRCGWRPGPRRAALLVFAGLLVGTATRQLGLVAIVAVALAIRRAPARPRWYWFALVASMVGTAIGLVRGFFDFRGYKPTFEQSLVAFNLPIVECGELLAFVLGLVMLKLVVGKLWSVASAPLPDTNEALRWFIAWFAYLVFALLGPRYSVATLFPATVVLAIGAVPFVQWIATARPLRFVLVALAVGIQVIAWSYAIATYVPIANEFRARIAKLEAAPRGSVVTIAPYKQIRTTFWAFGEDWDSAARRQLIALSLYGLRDIELVPAFRRLETNAQLTIRIASDDLTPAELGRAASPTFWATNLMAARAQFAMVLKDVRRRRRAPFSMQLVVDNLSPEVLRGRPLLAADYERGDVTGALKVRRKPPDDEGRQAIVIRPVAFAKQFPEAYAVTGDRATPITYDGAYRVQVLTTELHAVIACDPQRCFLVDAFIPAL